MMWYCVCSSSNRYKYIIKLSRFLVTLILLSFFFCFNIRSYFALNNVRFNCTADGFRCWLLILRFCIYYLSIGKFICFIFHILYIQRTFSVLKFTSIAFDTLFSSFITFVLLTMLFKATNKILNKMQNIIQWIKLWPQSLFSKH